MSDHENGEERDLDLSDDKVVTKYKEAAVICNSECRKTHCLASETLIAAWCRALLYRWAVNCFRRRAFVF